MALTNRKLAVIILTFNEEMHIERCIQSVGRVADKIYIIDSFSTDNTVLIANKYNVTIYQRKFTGYSDQVNFAISIVSDDYEYILRVDADEILSDQLCKKLLSIKPFLDNYSAYYIKRKILFNRKILNFGGLNSIYIIRLFNKNECFSNSRLMDEKIVYKGKANRIREPIYDFNLNSISYWLKKHDTYSSLEAEQAVRDLVFSTNSSSASLCSIGFNSLYYKFPPYLRSFFYFLFRYCFLLGFLDGINGLCFHFFQGFWYRFLVDYKIMLIKQQMINNGASFDAELKNTFDK